MYEPAITDVLTLAFPLLTLEGNVSDSVLSCLPGNTSALDLTVSKKKEKVQIHCLLGLAFTIQNDWDHFPKNYRNSS